MTHATGEQERRRGPARPARHGHRWSTLAWALLALLAVPCTAQIRLPKLDGLEAGVTPVPDSRSDAARALPPRVAICVDRGARRCWSAATAAQCESAGAAEVFRVLARDDGSSSPGEALAACWTAVGGGELRR